MANNIIMQTWAFCFISAEHKLKMQWKNNWLRTKCIIEQWKHYDNYKSSILQLSRICNRNMNKMETTINFQYHAGNFINSTISKSFWTYVYGSDGGFWQNFCLYFQTLFWRTLIDESFFLQFLKAFDKLKFKLSRILNLNFCYNFTLDSGQSFFFPVLNKKKAQKSSKWSFC